MKIVKKSKKLNVGITKILKFEMIIMNIMKILQIPNPNHANLQIIEIKIKNKCTKHLYENH